MYKLLQIIDGIMRSVLLLLVRLYQLTLSPLMPNCCRFHPTCSNYARQALEAYSTPKAVVLISRRIFRCNPFFKGGFDPIPISGKEELHSRPSV